MYIVILESHPDPESLCTALANKLEREFTAQKPNTSDPVRLHRLYDEDFNPVMETPELRRHIPIDSPASDYSREIQETDILCIVFPDWWGAEPAILKGWIDRILRPGVAYDRAEQGNSARGGSSIGLLSRVHLHVFITSDSRGEEADELLKVFQHRWCAIISRYCGFADCKVTLFPDVRNSRAKTRSGWIESLSNSVGDLISIVNSKHS